VLRPLIVALCLLPALLPAGLASAQTVAPAGPQLVASGFGQDKSAGSFAFIVQNPNPDYAYEDTPYQVAAYDAAGSVLKTESGHIEALVAGQQLGVAGRLYLPENTTISRLDVQLLAGRAVALGPVPTLTAENVGYRDDRYSPKVTGIVKSPYDKNVTYARISALAYDAGGAIIGGGFTFLNFVPAHGQSAVEVNVKTTGKPARVELYPTISGLSQFQ
jgi:hypothetical protein